MIGILGILFNLCIKIILILDKINQKISSDKNIIQKEKNTDDFNNKMAKILSNPKANDKKEKI